MDNEEALDAIELGARRIDFIGYKFQIAADCSKLYSDAQALAADKNHWDDVSEKLYSISSNNGRLQDIRDGYSQLGELFREAWLRDNRPYWLANNMARYDRETQMWIGRGEQWQVIIHRWHATHTLPAANEVGLPSAN